MNRSRWYIYARYSTWGILFVNFLLLAASIRSVNFILGILLLIWFFLSSWLATTLIPFLYQRYLARWWYWLLLLSLWVLGGLVAQSIPAPGGSIRVIAQAFLVFGTWAIGVSLSIQLFKHDFSLKLAAVLTLIWLWIYVIVFSQQRSLFDISLRFLVSGEPWFMWWVGALTIAGLIITPMSIASFLWHTALILWRELQDASAPPS